MRRLLAILLENEAGALSRVIGLFAQRNYNIETLNVAPTEDQDAVPGHPVHQGRRGDGWSRSPST